MIQIENTYFELGESCKKNCLIICDRGVMDASACEYTSCTNVTDAKMWKFDGCVFSTFT